MLDHIFVQTASIITTATDKYGDQVSSDEVSSPCKFRYITEVDNTLNREGLATADAIVWLPEDAPVQEGSILLIDGKYWRINRLVKARRMSSAEILFLKAFVNAHKLA